MSFFTTAGTTEVTQRNNPLSSFREEIGEFGESCWSDIKRLCCNNGTVLKNYNRHCKDYSRSKGCPANRDKIFEF
ncbi:hypothetical protein PMAYCL1PPCAC_25332, partial [Pristionchus mayeri]